MSNRKLSESDCADICAALKGLKGAKLSAEAARLAEFYRVSKATIYERTRSARPRRKKRSDAGTRKIDLMENEAVRGVAEFVANQKLAPVLALETVRENPHIFGELPEMSIGTMRRYLREHGISRVQQTKIRMIHRSFRAKLPGDIFQFDMSGVKERWVDVRTRRIHKVSVLEVSKNHANRRSDRIPLWKFTLVDDHSSKKFARFAACSKPNTLHVVEFLKQAFSAMGLPKMLYTDRDAIIHNKRMQRGAAFINEAFKTSGGFQIVAHTPGNPQATGKVERAHQIVEEYERLIGIKAEFGNQPHIESLNRFADWMCDRYNNRTHSTLGSAPNILFRNTTGAVREIDPAQFDAAFKARDLVCRVNPDVSIAVDGVKYQLSRRAADPFIELAAAGAKIEVYWIDDDDFFACITPAGDEYIVEKIEARADDAGEFKSLPETKSQSTRKALKESQNLRKSEIKEIQKTQDEPVLIVPGIDTDIPEKESTGILEFPQKTDGGDRDRLDELTHNIAAERHYRRNLDLFDALDLMQNEGLAPAKPCGELTETKSWLRGIFAGRDLIDEDELRTAIGARDRRNDEPKRALKFA
ncbi:MAG: transposase family protein [Pyrinomonadaceae bacterium]|nr:transposase family protein [Pyrinomonadaceae bacterium]